MKNLVFSYEVIMDYAKFLVVFISGIRIIAHQAALWKPF